MPDNRPIRECDIIMKGGITDGVVYPSAVVELAKSYRFRSVAGTSAGAMAAAATAAAEYGRREGTGGFGPLEALPEWLGQQAANGQSNLFNLFAPEGATRPLFEVLTAPLRREGPPLRLMLRAACKEMPWLVGAGALPGALLVMLALLDGPSPLASLSLGAGVACAALGSLIALSYRIYRLADKTLPETFFGLTTGHHTPITDVATDAASDAAPGAPIALTDWLAELIDSCAGVTGREKPLTFGDLWGEQPEHDIELQMMTTNATFGRPYRLPLETRTFFFDREEFRRLFPTKVYRYLVACGEARPSSQRDPRYLQLPEAKDLPVVVAARLSLSFPLLIGAVPLYAIDFTRVSGRDRVMTRSWFTDGGITCNFPVHFFDKPLPQRPTFTLDVRPNHPDYGPGSETYERDQGVWMPKANHGGIHPVWNRFDEKRGLSRVGGFLGAVVDTGFSWRDTLLLSFPGYRDRVVHIGLAPSEGGYNLNMPAEVIASLSQKGTRAGALLAERFSERPAQDVKLTWDNHRWVRYRAYMAALEAHLEAFHEAYTSCEEGQRSYEALLMRTSNETPSSYRLRNKRQTGASRAGQRAYAEELTCSLLELAEKIREREEDLQEGAPNPRPILRIVPDI